jgi:hypothetical protein
MVKRVTDKNTKAEILEVYQQLLQENETLEAQLQQAGVFTSPSQEKSTVVKEITMESQTMTFATTEQKRMQSTIDNLMKLQLGFGSAVSELSEKLTSEASKLEEIRQGVSQEIQQLKELHNLEEIREDTLETLIIQYEESAKTFAEELGSRRETVEQELIDLRKAWSKEQEEHQRAIKERDETHEKASQRDEETYQYNLRLERNLDLEQYQQSQKGLYQELQEFRQTQEKAWQERESAIAEREKLYSEVKAKVEEFPKKLEENIKNGKQNGQNIGHYQAKIKSDLYGKAVEGQKQYYELRIQALSQTIENQESRIVSLSKQLDASMKQVQDLAVKAIEGTSNSNSFQAMKEIALEQAKNPPKNK